MAQAYYPKSQVTRLTEGLVAGLLGGLTAVVVSAVIDGLVPNRSWWTTLGATGGVVTGVKEFNTASPDMGSLLVGLLLTLVGFALFGIGLIYYVPVFRRLNLSLLIGGAIYGLLLWLVVDLLFLNGLTSGNLNLWGSLLAKVLAGVVMAWWLARAAQTGGTPPDPTSTTDATQQRS